MRFTTQQILFALVSATGALAQAECPCMLNGGSRIVPESEQCCTDAGATYANDIWCLIETQAQRDSYTPCCEKYDGRVECIA